MSLLKYSHWTFKVRTLKRENVLGTSGGCICFCFFLHSCMCFSSFYCKISHDVVSECYFKLGLPSFLSAQQIYRQVQIKKPWTLRCNNIKLLFVPVSINSPLHAPLLTTPVPLCAAAAAALYGLSDKHCAPPSVTVSATISYTTIQCVCHGLPLPLVLFAIKHIAISAGNLGM